MEAAADWFTPVVGISLAGLLIAVSTLGWRAARWTGQVDSELGGLKNFMEEIRADIKMVFHKLPPPGVAEGQSPARLTDFGKEVSQTIGTEAWARDLAHSLKPEVAGMAEYQVEAFCRNYVHENIPVDDDRVLLGMYEHAIERGPVLSVLRIVLRETACADWRDAETALIIRPRSPHPYVASHLA